MFGIGTWELLIILVLALVILGPSKLPEVARQIGKTLHKLRRTADEVRREIDLEGVRDELRDGLLEDGGLRELQQSLDVRGEIRRAMAQLQEPPPLPGPEPPAGARALPGPPGEAEPGSGGPAPAG
jgi:Tat protein translocase TatB subunit